MLISTTHGQCHFNYLSNFLILYFLSYVLEKTFFSGWYITSGTSFTNMVQLQCKHGLGITCIIMCGMKSLIHFQTSTVIWLSNFIWEFTGHVFTYPCWDWSETMLIKGSPEIMESFCFVSQGLSPYCYCHSVLIRYMMQKFTRDVHHNLQHIA